MSQVNYIRAELHNHSTESDGKLSIKELVHYAESQAFEVLAVTDHNTVSGQDKAMQEARNRALDILPGVEITTTAPGGGYRTVTGTSFSVPFVTGSAALLMEWGIVRGNDPFLYGEKVRAYLQRGARPLPGFEVYPNEMVGYGEDVIIRLH